MSCSFNSERLQDIMLVNLLGVKSPCKASGDKVHKCNSLLKHPGEGLWFILSHFRFHTLDKMAAKMGET
jgi:hypothetical protein